MKTRILLALMCACAASVVHADIWECVDENGNKRFTNIRTEAKGCRQLNVAPPNTVPSSPAAGAAKGAPNPKAAQTPTPATFPRVDAQTQQQRDNDRRRILEQELANEQKLLDQAKKELADQESQRFGNERNYQRVLDRLEPYKKNVKLHEDNIANLRRELANVR